ncbi:MAG: hypothetical protein HY964_07915 [Ignavibacteriales bacterium]|nr:hypothetical protein [Ignavibacteriales bacterium]
MKQGKRIKPVFPIEYRLLVTPLLKERERKTVTLFAMRTVNEFCNFHYEISLDSVVEERTIRLTIRGLKAPQVSIPDTGPAIKKIEFDNLHGEYKVFISKHGKEENIFSIDVSEKKIKIIKSPKKKFIEIVTESDSW